MRVAFDEERLISDAGLLADRDVRGAVGDRGAGERVGVAGPEAPGAALPGRKVMSLVHGMLAGADRIDHMNVLRAGSTQLVLGHRVMAPSTLGRFCGRSRSGMSASSTVCLTSRSRGRGPPAPARATGRW